MTASAQGKPSPELQQLVAESDTGGRKVGGFVGKLIFAIAVGWSLFQLWYASPLPFEFRLGRAERHRGEIAASRHRVVPRVPVLSGVSQSASRSAVPWYDWLPAIVGAFAGAYFILFYADLATRPGKPILHGRRHCHASVSFCCSRRRGAPSACR